MADVYKILINSGLGLPKYYKWRTRSGCYLCHYQRRVEVVGLLENHPELFEKMKSYEKDNFTWFKGLPLEYFRENAEVIKARAAKRAEKEDPSLKPCDTCFI